MKNLFFLVVIGILVHADGPPCTRWEGTCANLGGPNYQIWCYCDDVLRRKECGWTADPIGRHRWCDSICLPGQKSRTDVCCNYGCGFYHGRVENNKTFFNATDATVIIFSYTFFTSLQGEAKAVELNNNVTVEGYKAKIESYGVPYVVIPPHSAGSFDSSSSDALYAVLFYKYDDVVDHDKQMLITGILLSPTGLGLQLMNNHDFVITVGSKNSVIRLKPLKRTTNLTTPTPRIFHNVSDFTVGAVVVLGIESKEKAGCTINCRNLPMPTHNEFLMMLGKGITAFRDYVDQKYGPIYREKGVQYLVLGPHDELDHTYDTGTMTFAKLDAGNSLRVIVYPHSQQAGDVRPIVRDVNANAITELNISTGEEILRINGIDFATVATGKVK